MSQQPQGKIKDHFKKILNKINANRPSTNNSGSHWRTMSYIKFPEISSESGSLIQFYLTNFYCTVRCLQPTTVGCLKYTVEYHQYTVECLQNTVQYQQYTVSTFSPLLCTVSTLLGNISKLLGTISTLLGTSNTLLGVSSNLPYHFIHGITLLQSFSICINSISALISQILHKSVYDLSFKAMHL